MRSAAPLAVSLVLAVAAPRAGAYPDTSRAILSVGATPVDLVVSADDRLVFVAGADGTLRVLDTADFDATPTSASACAEATSVAAAVIDGTTYVLLGCTDGTVVELAIDDSTIPATASSSAVYELGTGSIDDVGVSEDGSLLYALETGGSEDAVHAIDLLEQQIDWISGLPAPSYYSSNALVSTPAGTYAALAGDSGRVHKLLNGGSYATLTTYQLYGLGSFVDVQAVDDVYALLLEDSGDIVQYTLSSENTYVMYTLDLGSAVEELEVVEAADDWYFYVVDADGTVSVAPYLTSDVEASLAAGAPFTGGFDSSSASDGYVYAGTEDGVAVISEGPWIRITSVEPASIVEGESATVSVVADEDCEIEVYLGGGIDASGEHLSAYDMEVSAGETVSFDVAGDDLEEGDNRLFVFASAGGFRGRDSATVTLDTPPDALAGFELGFGDGKLVARWISSEETDIAHYLVYFADRWFDEASGAPEFEIEGEGTVTSSPGQADHPGEGVELSYTIEGLTNGVEYCVAVSAVDEGGQQGPWTETLCDEPEQTSGVGDELGYCGACGVSGAGGSWPVGLLLLAGLSGLLAARRAPGPRP